MTQQLKEKIIYGISPYQDTIIPKYAETMGWYNKLGLDLDIKMLEWSDIMSSLANETVNVALQNFNSFQSNYWEAKAQGIEPIFYAVTYVFKGAAIIVPEESLLKTVEESKVEGNTTEQAVKEVILQLKGKRIALTKGTEMEQVVLAALRTAGLSCEDVEIVDMQPQDSLADFLAKKVDAFSAGVTQHTEASRNGSQILLSASDVLPPVLDGLVTTQRFLEERGETLEQLVGLWYRSIKHLYENISERAVDLVSFLSRYASTEYTIEEYENVLKNFHYLPKSLSEATETILNPRGQYYWKHSWDLNNEFLLKEKKIDKPVPEQAFFAYGDK